MRLHSVCAATLLSLCGSALLFAQNVPLNVVPSRIVGHPLPEQNTVNSGNPNLVDGRELFMPEGIAVDTSVSPPILYVADTFNNRVLAWKNATGFANGQPADLVIGQQDMYHTVQGGPGTAFTTFLRFPTGLTVKDGDLYIGDSGNNRILRFRKPFQNTGALFPDMWLGQPNLNSRVVNAYGTNGQPSDKGVNFLGPGNVPYVVNMAFDPQNNLWIIDPGNRRVLRFDAADVAAGNGPLQAKVVIGQQTFDLVEPAVNAASRTDSKHLAVPSAIAFDSSGRMYVADANSSAGFGRVLVFVPNPGFTNFMSASRIMGVFPDNNAPSVDQQQRSLMASPSAIFFIPSASKIGVVDQLFHRILLFDSFESWPDPVTSSSPAANGVFGQPSYRLPAYPNQATDTTYLPPPNDQTLFGPGAAAFAGNELYIADTYNNRVLAVPYQGGTFKNARAVLGQDAMDTLSPNLIEGREFNFTWNPVQASGANDAGIAADFSGDTPRLYVADTYNNRILGFSDLRRIVAGTKADVVIGQPDFKHGLCNVTGDPNHPSSSTLCFPTGLLVDSNGNLYVADSGNGRVLRFPAPFAHQGLEQADLVLGQHNFSTPILDPSQSTMRSPYGLAFAGSDGLLVSDSVHNRVLFFRFGKSGTFDPSESGKNAEKVFGQPDFTTFSTGSGDTRMNSPHGISSDSEGRPYVADTGNSRVMIFDQINNNQNGAPAVKTIPIGNPFGVFVSPATGEAWITDSNAGQVKKYPKFQTLIAQQTPASNYTVQSAGFTLAATQDQYGDLIVADATNRVGFYFPGLQAVNNGNYIGSYPLAPGMFAAICSPGSACDPGKTVSYLTPQKVLFSDLPNPVPIPTTLGDTQVLFGPNQTAVPLAYVSPTQVNFYVPMSAPTSGTADVVVMQKSTGRIYAAGTVQMASSSPAILTGDTGQLRQAAVLNADLTLNSPTNPATRGSWISIYAIGQGFVPGAPPDGTPAPSSPLLTTPLVPQVNFNGLYPEEYNKTPGDPANGQFVNFSGLEPGFVGLWHINAFIPGAVKPGDLFGGNTVSLLVFMGSRPSNDVSQSGFRTVIYVKP